MLGVEGLTVSSSGFHRNVDRDVSELVPAVLLVVKETLLLWPVEVLVDGLVGRGTDQGSSQASTSR